MNEYWIIDAERVELPLRKITCSKYSRVFARDDGGNVVRSFYEVVLSSSHDISQERFEPFGQVFFNRYEQAVALCIGRLVGDFERDLVKVGEPLFDANEDNLMWSFEITERLNNEDTLNFKGCTTKIRVRNHLGANFAEYTDIGHMGLLGIMDIIDTIAGDNHIPEVEKVNIAMFKYNNRIYRLTHFYPGKLKVSGIPIISRPLGKKAIFEKYVNHDGSIEHLDYHRESVVFYRFGTIVKNLGRYYLDGEVVHEMSSSYPVTDNDEIMRILARKYPHAETYHVNYEWGSMSEYRNGEE